MLDDLIGALDEYVSVSRVDFADVRALARRVVAVRAQDGRLERAYSYTISGVGARVLVEGAWGFASVNEVSREAALKALKMAEKAARASVDKVAEAGCVAEYEGRRDRVRISGREDPSELNLEEKVECVLELNREMMRYDERVVNAVTVYREYVDRVVVVNTQGAEVEQEIVRVSPGAFAAAREAALVQRGTEIIGGTGGYEYMRKFVEERRHLVAAERAVKLLSARTPPSGTMPAVLSPSVVGVFIHEAFGHNSEGDLVLSGASILAGRVGEMVASELVTVVDDSGIEGGYGSYVYDDEGVRGGRRVIVERGILKGYLHSLETASKLGSKPNGSARAEDHRYRPYVRMSNTFIEPGDWGFEEMVSEIKRGIYCKASGWGYVWTERGQFTVNIDESYLIEDGEIGGMLRNVSIGGLTLELLKEVDAVGKDFELADTGMCGKNHQFVFVAGGGPHIRVRGVRVGGRA